MAFICLGLAPMRAGTTSEQGLGLLCLYSSGIYFIWNSIFGDNLINRDEEDALYFEELTITEKRFVLLRKKNTRRPSVLFFCLVQWL